MKDDDVGHLVDWIIGAGLAGAGESALLSKFCPRAVGIGIPIARVTVIVDTLHPIVEGRAFRRRSDMPHEAVVLEYGSTKEGTDRWRRRSFHHLLESGETMLRVSLVAPETPNYYTFDELRSEGMVDYRALIHHFAAEGVIGEMDCIYTSWTTDAPTGFSDHNIAALRRLSLALLLGLSVKSASLARIAGTLVETYLGRDPGRRVLGGAIARGVAEEIEAVIWYSDLRGYTRISDTAQPVQIIPLRNDYADAVITAVLDEQGDVLKLIGD